MYFGKQLLVCKVGTLLEIWIQLTQIIFRNKADPFKILVNTYKMTKILIWEANCNVINLSNDIIVYFIHIYLNSWSPFKNLKRNLNIGFVPFVHSSVLLFAQVSWICLLFQPLEGSRCTNILSYMMEKFIISWLKQTRTININIRMYQDLSIPFVFR